MGIFRGRANRELSARILRILRDIFSHFFACFCRSNICASSVAADLDWLCFSDLFEAWALCPVISVASARRRKKRLTSLPNASAAISASTGSKSIQGIPELFDHGISTHGVIDTKRYVRTASHSETSSLTFCRVVFEGVHCRWSDWGQSAQNGRPCFTILDFSFRAGRDKSRGTGCGLYEKIFFNFYFQSCT